MKKIKYELMLTCLFLYIMTIIGCGDDRPSDMPPLQPVVLTFIQDGVPLSDAIVTLYSTDPNFKWSVGGGTEETGQVVLMTNGRYTGAPEGKYKITVDKVVRNGPPVPKESELPEDEEQRQKIFNDIDKQTSITRIIDKKFLEEKSTPLEFDVVKGKNTQTFDLGKSVNQVLPKD